MDIGGLTGEMFRLSHTLAVPDILFLEELVEHHPELPAYGLRVLSLGESAIEEAVRLRERFPHPSQNDLFALALARQENCPLITGDKRLREAAEQEAVEANGALWVVEQMVIEKVIPLSRANDAYHGMKSSNRRLPWRDVERQLKRLAEAARRQGN